MSEYFPDGYQFLRISSDYDDNIIYKLFAVWVGGYTQGDSWKMNSGITSISQEGETLRVHGYSGSTYIVNKENQYMSSYGKSVLEEGIVKKAKDIGVNVELVNAEDVINALGN